MDFKDYDIVFAPGCFDNFDGTQEELDELIDELKSMVTSGEFFEKSEEVDLENDDLPDGLLEAFESYISYEKTVSDRNKKLN